MTRDRFPMTAGRWVALAAGAPIALALIGWTSLNAIALVGEGSFPVSYSVPVHDHALTVHVAGGDFTVRPQAGSSALLTGIMHYSLIKPHLRFTSEGIAVSCRLPVGGCGLDGSLGVPAGTALRLSSDGGNLSVSGLASSVTLTSAGGDLTAQNLSGDLTLSSDGGNITGYGLTDPLVSAHSSGGDITLTFTQVPLNVTAGTDGGNVTVTLPYNSHGYNLIDRTDGGNVSVDPSVHVNNGSPDVVTLTTSGGDISVTEAAAS